MRKPTKKPTRFASYLRCSTDDQSFGDFTTIDTQRAINAEHIAQLGGELVAEYNDEGRTGTNLNRKEWKRMLADAGGKRFDAVVVTYMSRLARGQAYYVAEYLLGESKVSVEMVKEKFSPDMIGQMHKQMTIMMDGNYPLQVSRWTKTKQAEMVRMGYHTGGMRPFGYATETVPGMQATTLASGKVKPAPKRLVPHETEAAIARHAFELALTSRSVADVQRYLRSVDSTRRWPMTLVTGLLSSDKYIGVARFGENVNLAAHPAIISKEIFDAVQELLAHPEEQIEARAAGWSKGREKDDNSYYLRGIIFCGHCGGRMTPAAGTGRTGARVPYYECIQAQKNGKACPIKRVNANALHDLLLVELARCTAHPSRLERLYSASLKDIALPEDGAEELRKLRRNVRETEKKIGRIVEAIKAGGASMALTRELRDLEGLKEKQESAITALESDRVRRTIPKPDLAYVTGLWEGFLGRWEALTPEERTMLLRLVVDRVNLEAKNKAAIWLSIGTEPDSCPPSLLSQSDDVRFAECDSFSAGVYRSMKHRSPARQHLRLPLIVPSLYRRRRGITEYALIEQALRSSTPES